MAMTQTFSVLFLYPVHAEREHFRWQPSLPR